MSPGRRRRRRHWQNGWSCREHRWDNSTKKSSPRFRNRSRHATPPPHATWMSAAILQEFGRLRRKEWSTGLQGLKGCTTLYIISRKAVYATHWWENISFDPDTEWRDPPTQTNAELFKLTVTDMLRDGGRYHRKLDADLIEDDYIRAYLIAQPRFSGSGQIQMLPTTPYNGIRSVTLSASWCPRCKTNHAGQTLRMRRWKKKKISF